MIAVHDTLHVIVGVYHTQADVQFCQSTTKLSVSKYIAGRLFPYCPVIFNSLALQDSAAFQNCIYILLSAIPVHAIFRIQLHASNVFINHLNTALQFTSNSILPVNVLFQAIVCTPVSFTTSLSKALTDICPCVLLKACKIVSVARIVLLVAENQVSKTHVTSVIP
jgi:hypothetical protein